MIKKLFKYVFISFLIIFLILNGIIIFSGRWYLYKAIATTYIEGKDGPSATEYQIFENRKIEALNPQPWPTSREYNTGKLSSQLETTLREVETIVDSFFDIIVSRLAEGGRVELRGFGAFSTRARDGRTGRNPRTGDSVPVEAKRVPHFNPGKEMRERLNV